MRRGWKLLSMSSALALLISVAPAPLVSASHAASKSSPTSSAAKSKRSMRQFSGVVTALDKTSITVEKGGKKPRTMTFVKHEEMRSTGEIEKDTRVTVYYREEGGRAVAHRVVVRGEKANS